MAKMPKRPAVYLPPAKPYNARLIYLQMGSTLCCV